MPSTMTRPRRFALAIALLFVSAVGLASAQAAPAPAAVGNFGPTGLSVQVNGDKSLTVLDVAEGSPAAGKVTKGETILTINGQSPVSNLENQRAELGEWITKAEATDGKLTVTLKREATPDAGKTGEAVRPATGSNEVTITIPVLGEYSDTWPIDCPKTQKIIRADADYIGSQVKENVEAFTKHDLYNGFAILMLLSTGEEQDLEAVRSIYKARMANFEAGTDVGSHNWHNGVQGIAVCEYFLRTGDDSVMPLINAICESIRKYEVQGGWSHWAKGINPQYVGGGLLNAAGTQNLTTLLLAKQCGAKVDDETLLDSLTFFYRFVGHGASPYGDHRPEDGFGSNNGKTEMLALAMNAASKATNGDLYAKARDRAALMSMYNYPNMLQGHTGGLGTLWYGQTAAIMAEKKPDLYKNRFEQTKWFYELSRRHTGAFGSSGSGRYDEENYGYAVGLGLTAPLRTLQITGASPSPHAKPFTLPDHVWGREADLAFFTIDGGPAYQGSDDPPHIEAEKIAEADEAGLRSFASHPVQAYREWTANAIRDQRLTGLVEELLKSDDPLARQTGCMVINRFEPWVMSQSIGPRGRYSLAPEDFSPAMFESLMGIINDPDQALWNVDQALLALAAATSEQVSSRMDEILPWLEHEEWWLNEAACMALLPAMTDKKSLEEMLPALTASLARNLHAKGRGTMLYKIKQVTRDGDPEIRERIAEALVEVYERTPSVPDPEPGVDLSGITSNALLEVFNRALQMGDTDVITAIAEQSVNRLDEMRAREVNAHVDSLIDVARDSEDWAPSPLTDLIVEYYRPVVVGDNPGETLKEMEKGTASGIATMNKLLKIDRLAGRGGGWQMLGVGEDDKQVWWVTSFDPPTKPAESAQNRYREVALPESLQGWNEPDFDPEAAKWTEYQSDRRQNTSDNYRMPKQWLAQRETAGEVVLARKTFEIDAEAMDAVMVRLSVYSRQGFDVYLNGHLVAQNKGRSKTMQSRDHYLKADARKHLEEGANTLAVRTFLQYFRGKDGAADVFIEVLPDLPAVE